MNLKAKILSSISSVSPSLTDSLRYFARYKRLPSKSNPRTLEEKLLVIKHGLYDSSELVANCADKYKVREYIEAKGCGFILNDLYLALPLGEPVDFDLLPETFAMKMNTGCGMNYFCKNKFDEMGDICNTISAWSNYEHTWLASAEMHYEKIKPYLIFEQYLDIIDEGVEDYKVYCFNGKPLAIMLMSGRFSDAGLCKYFMSTDWEYLGIPDNSSSPEPSYIIERPECLDDMIECSKKLSSDFPFVRIDYYIASNKLYFGEMTFTPSSCIGLSQVTVNGVSMGDFLNID